MAEADRPLWTQMTFSAAEENFHTAALDGIDAQIWWPRLGEVAVTDLVCDVLLPLAYDGLDRFGVDPVHRDELLGIIEARCRTRRNGAVWQAEMVRHLQEERGMDRMAALREMLRRYSGHLHGNDPVHTWPLT
jgi:hypothetical protein